MTALRRSLRWWTLSLVLVAVGAALALISFWPRPGLYAIEAVQDSGPDSVSAPVYKALEGNRRILSDLVAYAPLSAGKVTTSARGRTASAAGEMVSGNYFPALGVRMRVGAPFNEQDVRRHTPAVVLSLDLWTKLFHRDPGAPGQTVYIDGRPFAVFGVTTEGFSGIDPRHSADFWIPLENDANHLHLIARLARGIGPDAAAPEISRVLAKEIKLTAFFTTKQNGPR